jgi:hypothetical protein
MKSFQLAFLDGAPPVERVTTGTAKPNILFIICLPGISPA